MTPISFLGHDGVLPEPESGPQAQRSDPVRKSAVAADPKGGRERCDAKGSEEDPLDLSEQRFGQDDAAPEVPL